MKLDYERLKRSLENSYYEDGMYSQVEFLFIDYLREDKKTSLEFLKNLVEENLDNEQICEGILRCLHNSSYEDVMPLGKELIDKIFNKYSDDILFQSLYVECIEEWKQPSFIETLEKLSFKDRINEEYRLSIIKYLKKL